MCRSGRRNTSSRPAGRGPFAYYGKQVLEKALLVPLSSMAALAASAGRPVTGTYRVFQKKLYTLGKPNFRHFVLGNYLSVRP